MHARIMQAGFGLALLATSGCELIADFDRSQIPGNGFDSGVVPMMPLPDAGPAGDASVDGGDEDAGDDDAGQ